MNITRSDVARLGRRAQQPERAEGEILAVFIAGHIENPLNGSLSGAHWTKKRRWAKTRREAAGLVIMEAIQRLPFGLLPVAKTVPKRVTFIIHGHNPMDDDNRRAACKPYRDALKDMRIIDDDSDKADHRFVYPPVIVSRGEGAKQGLEIRVRLR